MLSCTKVEPHDHAAKMQDALADAVENAEVAETQDTLVDTVENAVVAEIDTSPTGIARYSRGLTAVVSYNSTISTCEKGQQTKFNSFFEYNALEDHDEFVEVWVYENLGSDEKIWVWL